VNKGLIFDIRRFTVHDGPGIRTTVFFKGCPLQCWWCHNPESQCIDPEESEKTFILDGKKYYQKEVTGQWMTIEKVMHELNLDRVFYEESNGGVTFSGGEPLLQDVFLLELLKECKSTGLHTTIDTCGCADQSIIDNICPYTDLFLYDLKLMDDNDHLKYTGISNKKILQNLIHLISKKKKIIIRIPVIPGITDTDKNINEIKEFLLSQINETEMVHTININLLPFHSIAKNKYSRLQKSNKTSNLKDVSEDTLIPLKNEFEAAGFSVKIGG
jgi:pyruvate formate lyase activating enzyme